MKMDSRLHHWPAYCAHFYSLDGLQKTEPELELAIKTAWAQAQRMTAARRSKRASMLHLAPAGRPMPSLPQLLAALGLEKYTEQLEANEIDLEAISLCADVDFAEMEIPKGPRVKIAAALRQLQAQQQQSNGSRPKPAAGVLPTAARAGGFERGGGLASPGSGRERSGFTSNVLPSGGEAAAAAAAAAAAGVERAAAMAGAGNGGARKTGW